MYRSTIPVLIIFPAIERPPVPCCAPCKELLKLRNLSSSLHKKKRVYFIKIKHLSSYLRRLRCRDLTLTSRSQCNLMPCNPTTLLSISQPNPFHQNVKWTQISWFVQSFHLIHIWELFSAEAALTATINDHGADLVFSLSARLQLKRAKDKHRSVQSSLVNFSLIKLFTKYKTYRSFWLF